MEIIKSLRETRVSGGWPAVLKMRVIAVRKIGGMGLWGESEDLDQSKSFSYLFDGMIWRKEYPPLDLV
jgi:hypothetical protein